MKRKEILENLHDKISDGIPIVGCGAGCGMSAIGEVAGGADMIIAYGTGQYRMAGRNSMAGRFAFGDANSLVVNMLKDIIPVCKNTPVMAGVFAQDPFRNMEKFIYELRDMGCSGVQNIPGVGGQAQMEGQDVLNQFEALGLGFGCETRLMSLAVKNDMIATPYCSQPFHVKAMAEVGADIFVLHMGLTGRADDKSMVVTPLDLCVDKINELGQCVINYNSNAIIIAHGGPIVTPEDFFYLKEKCPNLHGFYGASSIERIPVEKEMVETIKSLKNIKLKKCGGKYE